jgi:hypothetical protein
LALKYARNMLTYKHSHASLMLLLDAKRQKHEASDVASEGSAMAAPIGEDEFTSATRPHPNTHNQR